MDSICVHCNADAYDDEEQVCTACGIVTEGIQFTSELSNPHSSDSNFKPKHWRKKPTPSGLLYAISILKNLSKLYNIQSDVKAEILELLKSVHAKTSFRYKQDIGVMAGCCLLHVQKKYQLPVPLLSDLCSKLECSKKQVFRYNKLLKLKFDVCAKNNFVNAVDNDKIQEKPDECNTDLLKKLESLMHIKLSSIPEDSKATLILKTTALIKLAYSCWLVSGRSPDSVISAAAFLCWKSMNPNCKKLSFRQFCSDFSLPYHNSQGRVVEMKQMLLKLGQGIPSFTKNYVHGGNVLFHLDYILENSETLRNDLFPGEFNVDEIEKKEFSTFRTCVKKKKETDKVETRLYDSDMRASEIDISDTEINSYIRTEKQIEMIKNLRRVKKKR